MVSPRSRPDSACPECFAYPWLRDYIVDHSTDRGTCPSCRRRNQPLVPVSRLYDPFLGEGMFFPGSRYQDCLPVHACDRVACQSFVTAAREKHAFA